MATSMREEIKVGPLAIRFLVEGEQSGGSVAVFEFDVPAGMQVAAAHSHDGYEETIYGLEGLLTWTVDGTPVDIGPDEVLCIPPRRRPPVRQPARGRRDGARDHHSGHPRPRLLPRGRRGPRHC